MAFTTGTATDYVDLLDKLRLYLVAQGWTQLQWAAGTVAGGGGNLVVRGPGAGAGKQTFVELFTYADPGSLHYCWRMRGMTDWNSGEAEALHAGSQQLPGYFALWENAIDYWFYVNDRRFIVVAKMGTIYNSTYAGFFLPFATPDAYPFPLAILAGRGHPHAYNLVDASYRFFADPGGVPDFDFNNTTGAFQRDPDGTWLGISNHLSTSGNDRPYSNGRSKDAGFIHPFSFGEQYGAFSASAADKGGSPLLEFMVRTRQGEAPLWPLTLGCNLRPPLGVLDGAYAFPGTGLVPEQIITVGARNFRAFQNIHRNSGNDFVLIEEV